MLTLFLFRHAKSDWSESHLTDRERPLSARGRQAAPSMGAYMARHAIAPDLVVSSTSVRTRQTCALAFAAFAAPPPIRFEQALYLASAATIIDLVQRTPPDVRGVMIVGHNPGLQDVALALVGSGDTVARAAISAKFPTAALATITFDRERWPDVRPGGGRLVGFMTPRRLAG